MVKMADSTGNRKMVLYITLTPLPTSHIEHRTGYSLLKQGQSCHRVHPEVLAVGLSIVGKVCGPIPLNKEVQ